jgi:spermidine/putrescine transport system permease protein
VSVRPGPGAQNAPVASAPDLRLLCLLPASLWLLLFSFLPLGIVVAISFVRRGSPIAWDFTLENYARLADPLLLTVFWRSLRMAWTTTVLCLLIGYPLAYFIAQRAARLRTLLYFLALIPLWANSLVLTYAWMVLLRTDGVFDRVVQTLGWIEPGESLNWLYTPGAIIVGFTYWYLPFMVYPLYAALEKFDWGLLDAAQDLGATRMRALMRVVLPLTRPAAVAGSLLVFIPSLGNFVVPQLLGGAKSTLLGNVIQERFLSQPQDWPLGAALSLVMLLWISAAIWLYVRTAHGEEPVG